jgi:hypothetical protein
VTERGRSACRFQTLSMHVRTAVTTICAAFGLYLLKLQ